VTPTQPADSLWGAASFDHLVGADGQRRDG